MLPGEGIEAFRQKVDWNAPDVADQVNSLLREMAVKSLQAYQSGGNVALGAYRDKEKELDIASAFKRLLNEIGAPFVFLPELNKYLLHFPEGQLKAVVDFFYWENVKFGLKNTLRVNHVSIISSLGNLVHTMPLQQSSFMLATTVGLN